MLINKSKKFSEFFEKKEGDRKIDFLVLHHVEADSVEHAIEQFEEHGVSAHFLIAEDGKVFELVDENDVAYHAGMSFWKGFEGLNANSIGIEFINSAPFEKKFEKIQLQVGLKLCQYLMQKYHLKPQDVIGHSDIGYIKETGFLDRKQDPSHLFDWRFLGENGVGVFVDIFDMEEKLFEMGNEGSEILKIKEKLQKFGYKVVGFNEKFDEEMQALARVFNRHFCEMDCDFWMKKSRVVLDRLTSV
ncbi:MAG: N-acetylmuramoyl-L-alanine amidase [Pseudomonadota bacterium]